MPTNVLCKAFGFLQVSAIVSMMACHSASAQILVTTNGAGPLTFPARPPAAQWSTRGVAGGSGDITTSVGLDNEVQANSAGLMTTQVGTGSGFPPGTANIAIWGSDGYLQTRPTLVRCILLMATLRNNSGAAVSSIDLAYDLTAVSLVPEELPGHRVYYSLSGSASSWQTITNLSGDGVSGHKTASLNLGLWTNNAALYILWADDNAAATSEDANQIDNFAVAPLLVAPKIALQPQSQSVAPGGAVSFTVNATGLNPLSYQWRKNSNDIVQATNQVFTIANAQASDEGFYSVVVSNGFGTATSTDAVLIVSCAAGVTITGQPQGQTNFSGNTLNLSVAVSGTVPLSFQWQRSGTNLLNATNQSFTRASAQLADSGSYSVIVSNCASAATSSVVTVWVSEPPYSIIGLTNQFWKYEQSGADLGTAWRETAFNDSDWPSGRGVLAFEDNPLIRPLTNTVLSLTGTNGSVTFTFYFRTHFTLTNVPLAVSLLFSNLIDDGAVAYLNGAEIYRINMPTTPINASTTAFNQNSEGVFIIRNLPGIGQQGDNVLAVEIHQTHSSSTDIDFGLALIVQPLPPDPPVISMQPASQTVGEGTPASFSSGVLGGQPLIYQWFQNGAPLSGETSNSLSIAAVHSVNAGNYHFVVSNYFGAATSSVATLSIIPDVVAPAVTLAQITNGFRDVLLVFSEPISAASATNLSNYSFVPAVSVLSAQHIAPNTVLLTTSGLDDVQSDYTVTIANISDLADNPNVNTPGASARVRPNRIPTATGLLQVQTVFIILMENKAWLDIKDSTNAPYLNSLLPQASYCENYTAPNNLHPSQPNYIWLEAGDHFGHVNDFGPAVSRVSTTNHLATQLFNAGVEWRGYMESMDYGSVGVTNGFEYLARHNPFAFFDDVTTNYPYCTNHVRPYADFADDLAAGRIGRYNFITPNVTNDMHSFAPGSTSLIRQGDDWLALELPRILNSSAFSNNGAVFITWDENDFTDKNAIGMIVLSPLVKGGGYASTVAYDHSSTLRTMQEIFRVRPFLGAAANAGPLSDLFKDFSLSIVRSNGTVVARLENMLSGTTNYVQASSNLVNWTTISTNVATNVTAILDPGAVGNPQRFYRAIQKP